MRLALVVAVLLTCACTSPAADVPADVPAAGLSEQEVQEGFVRLFDGKSLDGWQGSVKGYAVEDGLLVCLKKGGGQLFAKKEYADFVFRFEFKLEPGGNNGIGIRTPMGGDPAYDGMEIQIIDDSFPDFSSLKPYQAHGSVYGVVPAKRGSLKPVGQWNAEEIRCQGSQVRVTLNGTVIVDVDLSTIHETPDGEKHPGLHNAKGYIGLLGHGARVEFRSIRVKELPPAKPAEPARP